MAVVQHKDQSGSNLHPSKVVTFTGSPSSYVPTQAGIFVVNASTNIAYRTTGTTAGALVALGASVDLDAYATTASVTSAIATHSAASDPHTGYVLESALNESIDDRVATLLQAGSNITLAYNDTAGTLTIASSGGGGSGTVNTVSLVMPSSVFDVSTTGTADVTHTVTFDAQPANTFLAGASTGGSATPSFRTLVAADIPFHNQTTATITDFAEAVDDRVASLLQAGTGINLNYNDVGNILTISTTGTVTSVGLSAPNIFSVTGSPITGSGTLSFTPVAQPANRVWASPVSGVDAVPAFRALVAADIPAIAQSGVTGLPTALSLRPTSDTTGITGASAITNIVSMSQASYDALSPKSTTTLYIIV